MCSVPYYPRVAAKLFLEASDDTPSNATNVFTKNLVSQLATECDNLLTLPNPTAQEMCEIAGALNTGCLLANELTNGQFFVDHPNLQRGEENFSEYYLQD